MTLEIWGRLGADAHMRALIVANALADLATAHEQPPGRMAVNHSRRSTCRRS
jgi:hypothetical protein